MSYWIVPLFAAVANALLAISVANVAPRSELSRAFAFLATMFVFWNLNFFSLYFFEDYDTAEYATRVFRLGAVFLPAATFHLVASLQTRNANTWTWTLWANYFVATLLAVANLFDLSVIGLRRYEWGYYSVAGPLYGVFATFLLVNLVAALCILVHDYRTATDPRIRLQLRFWLIGAIIAIPLGCTNLLPAYGIQSYPLGSLGNTAWASLVAYAIARHRLMDIDVVVTKSASIGIATLVVIIPIFIFVIWIQRQLLGFVHQDLSFFFLIALALTSFAFPRLLSRLEPSLHASLFPAKREHRQALISFTQTITKILDSELLLRELAANLSRNLHLESVLVLLAEGHAGRMKRAYSIGGMPNDLGFMADPRFREFLSSTRGPVLLSEITDNSEKPIHQTIAQYFAENGWEVCVPLRVGKSLLGSLILGRKAGLDAYTAQDLELLEALGAEASIALDNSRLYSELRQSQDLIRRADRSSAMGVLAAGIAHEIRNPLVSIQTFFQLAPERLHDEEFATTFLETASGEVRRISQLINELLSFARSPTTEFGLTNLNEVVRGVFVLLLPEAKKHRITLIQDEPIEVPPVWGNFEQIRQVLINLIFNAIHATPPGGTISVIVRESRFDGREFGQVEVRDTGCGIVPTDIENLFDPFFTTKATGTGLGLAIAQRIIAEHQGRISVTSDYGHGSCFFVDIPIKAPNHLVALSSTEDARGEKNQPSPS